MKEAISRRAFLKSVGAFMTWLAVSCRIASPDESTPSPTPVQAPQPPPSATATPQPTVASEAAMVGLARAQSVREAVREAVDLAGGLNWLRPGATVLVKPNVNSDDPHPGTTNPQVLAAVLELVKERSPRRLIVADRSNPRFGTRAAMQKVGLLEAAQAAEAEVLALEDHPWRLVRPEEAIHWENGFEVPSLMDEIDYLITLPVVKTHSIAAYTMALKNSVGLIHPRSRSILHTRGEPDFGAMIAEIHLWRRPDFVVLDGTRAFVSGGPSQGHMVEPGLILASRDAVAADAAGLALLKTLGTTTAIERASLWAQPQLARAVELGIGAAKPGQMALKGEAIVEMDEMERHLRS